MKFDGEPENALTLYVRVWEGAWKSFYVFSVDWREGSNKLSTLYVRFCKDMAKQRMLYMRFGKKNIKN